MRTMTRLAGLIAPVLLGAAIVTIPASAAGANRTLVADSCQTAFCAYTSAATLAGVGMNTLLGWWQADPIAALVIAALAFKEGLEAWHYD